MEDNFDLTELTKKTRKKVNSRQKGSAFERKVCTILNETFDTNEFCRSPGSGAFATTHTLPKHLKIYGDIITPEKFRFSIECKKGYNNINLYSLLDYSSKFWEFIEKSKKDADSAGREFMVILQQDRQPILCVTENSLLFHSIDKTITIINNNKLYEIFLFEDALKLGKDVWFNQPE